MHTAILTLLLSLGVGADCDPQVALYRPTLLGLEPLKTPFSRIDRERGAPALRLRDPAGGEVAPVMACLRGGGKGQEAYLLIESSAAGGYGRNSLTGLRLSLQPPAGARRLGATFQPAGVRDEQCAASPLLDRTVSFSNGLRLGLSRAEVTALLGRPSETSGAIWTYRDDRREAKAPACPTGSADYAELRITFGPDGASEIHVERSDMR